MLLLPNCVGVSLPCRGPSPPPPWPPMGAWVRPPPRARFWRLPMARPEPYSDPCDWNWPPELEPALMPGPPLPLSPSSEQQSHLVA